MMPTPLVLRLLLVVSGVLCALPADAQDGAAVADSLSREAATAYGANTAEEVTRALELWSRAEALHLAAGDAAKAAMAAHDIGQAHLQLGRPDSALIHLRRALEVHRATKNRSEEGFTLFNIGRAQRALGAYGAALDNLAESLALYREIGDRESQGVILNEIGASHRGAGDVVRALEAYDGALEIFRSMEKTQRAAATLRAIGQIQRERGAPSAALATLRESLELYRGLGDRGSEAYLLNEIGEALQKRGPVQRDSAQHYFQQALVLHEEVGQQHGAGLALHNFARTIPGLSEPDRALRIYQIVVDLFRDLGDPRSQATALRDMARLHSMNGKREAAAERYREALEASVAAGDLEGQVAALKGVGLSVPREERPPYFDRAIAIQRQIEDPSGLADLLYTVGLEQYAGADFNGSLRTLAEALAITRRLGNREREADILHGMGTARRLAGDYDGAIARFEEESAVRREAVAGRPRPPEPSWLIIGSTAASDSTLLIQHKMLEDVRRAGNQRQIAGLLPAIGSTHLSRGQLDSASVYFSRSAEIYERLGDAEGLRMILGATAAVQARLGRHETALETYRRVRSLARETGSLESEAVALHNIGIAFGNLELSDSSLHYLRLSLDTRLRHDKAQGYFLTPPPGSTLQAIGVLHERMARPDSAFVHYNRALAVRYEERDSVGLASSLATLGAFHRTSRPDSALSLYQHALDIYRAQVERGSEGEMLRAIGSVHHRQRGDLRTAVTYYDSAAVIAAELAGHAGGDANRLSFSEQAVALFDAWVLAWLGRPGGIGEGDAAYAALAAGERGRAQALLELMRRSGGRNPAAPGGPTPAGADLIAEGRQLAGVVARSGVPALSYIATTDTLIAFLLLPDGRTEVVRTAVPQDTLAALVARLRAGLGVDSAAVRAAGGLRDTPLLEARTRGFEVEAGGAGGLAEAGARLTALLLPDQVRRSLPAGGELVVVPGGPLNLLPFAALPLPDDVPVGARYALRYAPSLRILAELEASGGAVGGVRGGRALVVGNPSMPAVASPAGERVTLSPLPGAEAEAAWVAGLLDAGVLSGDDATEAAVRERLPSAGLVHLATHGYAYASESRARDSFIALAPGEREDGLLTVGEVLDGVGRLSAELVVLSACQTGLGDLKQAEGTVGLQRAFLARGARGVLVTLWSVSDEATALLMQRFYTHWLGEGAEPATKAEALRRAQADVAADPRFAHPRYWSAFQLVGAR